MWRKHSGQLFAASVNTAAKSCAQPAQRPSESAESWHNTQRLACVSLRHKERKSMPNVARKIYLIHGWGANRHIFDDFAPRLPAAWNVVTPDLPGHGGAPFDSAFDIAAAADGLAAQFDTPADLLGWSLGGLVALHIAAHYPEKVRSLCLTAGFAKLVASEDYPEGLAAPALGRMIDPFQQDYAKYMKLFLQLQLLNTPNAAEITAKVLPDLVSHGAPAALQAALDAAEQADTRSLLPKIHTPTLLVYGGKDSITPPRMGEYLARHLPNSRLHLIEKAAHTPFLSHADEFAEVYRGVVEAV
ncbi:pimeloyl-[acyl-carrier protein] methyl ester esterase [Neisseria chenwenguii]|nr:pimeloyl-[acyl-carrier protein] methyl ester esterase [Neisseria chenwenguii]